MNDAEKRKKVIAGLEACNRQSYNGSDCQNCPYYDDEDTAELPFGICNIQDMFDDALALLKEQEPRVMTVDEVRDCVDNVWAEIFTPMNERRCLIYCPIVQNQGYPETADLDEDSGQSWARRWDNYGKTWRCWTFRPTEEQRKAVAWE